MLRVHMKNKPHESPDCKCAPCREWNTNRLFDFHSRGSIPIDMLLELLNIDPEEVREFWLSGTQTEHQSPEQEITVDWRITM
jgi:hypothetical protein